MLSLALRSPRATVAAVCLLVVSALSLLHRWTSSAAQGTLYSDLVQVAEASVPIAAVLEAISLAVQDSISKHDARSAHSEIGANIGDLSPESYRRHLGEVHAEYFATDESMLSRVVDNLSILPKRGGPIPRNIFTTDLAPPDQLPEQFASWTTKNPEWKTIFVGDEAIDDWLDTKFARRDGRAGVQVEMEALKIHGVVRADLFRYLVLLLEGGVYTDTDTACVRPIAEWGTDPDRHPTTPLEAALPHLLALTSASPTTGLDTEVDEPGLIIAIEMDALPSGTDWRKMTFARGVQIVQWTLAAKPFHPVLLDVLGHTLATSKRVRESAIKGDKGDLPNILDWSGPGAFTDAVMRYLLVRYGVHPRSLSGLMRPTRFGDVLVMPMHSFRAEASEGLQGKNRVVWHGFYGRWKAQDREERAKKS